VKETTTSCGGDASPSYDPPRDCNISSLFQSFHFLDSGGFRFCFVGGTDNFKGAPRISKGC